MCRLRMGSLLFCALITASADTSAERLHNYVVNVDTDLSAVSVHACFAGPAPDRLVAESLDASLALERAMRTGTRKPLEPNGTELRLGAQPDDSCFDYRVNLLEFSGRHQRGGNPTRRIGRDLISDLGLWFWRPATLAEDEDIEVAFTLPDGISVSAPWQRTPPGAGKGSYRVGRTPNDWPGTVAFGHFTEHAVLVPGGELHAAVLDGRPRLNEAQTIDWLQRAAGAVAALYARFPVASLQIVVVPGAQGAGPVPSAYVLRGGGPGAHFFVNQRRPIEEFLPDWSAVHELSHLLLPYIDPDDAWLSEGVASYYQTHPARARRVSSAAREAWQSMHQSFQQARVDETGRHARRRYRTDVSQLADFMRVYWEGAAIMLLADQRLRERSGGRQSLDTVLEQLRRCCLAPDVKLARSRSLSAAR